MTTGDDEGAEPDLFYCLRIGLIGSKLPPTFRYGKGSVGEQLAGDTQTNRPRSKKKDPPHRGADLEILTRVFC
jgi:hypothetical protein